MTIADPFVLSHNITKNVNERTRMSLIAHLKIAAELTSIWPKIGDRDKPWGLAGKTNALFMNN